MVAITYCSLIALRFINRLFEEILLMKTLFYYQLLTFIKQSMILFEKIVVFERLIDTYNYIFLIYFSLAGAEPDPKDDIFQTQLIQWQPTSF